MDEFEKYLETIKRMAEQEGYDSLDEVYVQHLKSRFLGEDVIIGKTQRLTLREMKITDIESFYSFEDAGQEEVLRTFIKESKTKAKEYLQAYIEHMYPMYDYGIWTVEKNDTKEIIGICGLGQAEVNGEFCTDLGYYICPKCRKQGFATECVEFVLDYAKNYLEFLHVYAIIKEENRISKGLLRKFGFQYQKTCKDSEGEKSVYKKDLKEQR